MLLGQDTHASLLSASAPHQPLSWLLQLLMALSFHTVTGFITDDAHLYFHLPPQFSACLSPFSAVPMWCSAGDTQAVFSLPCWQLCSGVVWRPIQSALSPATCSKEPCTDPRVHHTLAVKGASLAKEASETKYSCKVKHHLNSVFLFVPSLHVVQTYCETARFSALSIVERLLAGHFFPYPREGTCLVVPDPILADLFKSLVAGVSFCVPIPLKFCTSLVHYPY